MTLDLAVLLIAIIVMSFAGLVVYARNPSATVSKVFAALTLWVIIWSVTNYIADHVSSLVVSDLATRFVFVAGGGIVFSLIVFSHVFPVYSLNKRLLYSLLTFAIPFAVFAASPLVVQDVHKAKGGVSIVTGPLYLGYIVMFAALMISVLRNFLHGYKNKSALKRNQVRVITLGVFASVTLGVATNLLLPILLHDWTSSQFGPIATVIFVTSLAYAIIRHRFLDIRLIVTRTIAYALLLITLAGLYAVAVFGVTTLFFRETELSFLQQLFYLGIALVLALSFPPLKRFFDRATQALFYRDAYSIKDVLDQMSTVLVSAISVDRVAKSSLRILSQSIKPNYANMLILTHGSEVRQVSSRATHQAPSPELVSQLSKFRQPLIVLDEIEGRQDKLHDELQKANIGVVARLQTPQEQIGFMVFGYKQSGSMFTTQDLDLIRIVSDELAVALQNALRFEEISQFNTKLKKEIADATAELRETNKRLRELDRAKDEFLSMASHQLRTPLTSVKGYLSMAMEGDAGKMNAGQIHLLKESFSSAQRMVYLVNDFLNVSRIKTGKFTIDKGEVLLNQMIKQEVNQLLPEAQGRNITLESVIPDHFPHIRLDESKVRQVVMNLLDNAVYYSREGGTVRATLQKRDGWVEFTVEDHGIGVPKDEQPHMFEKFFRASNAKRVRADGTGVGLYVAKKVVTSHGGEMIFISQPGKGSTFGFRLPLDKDQLT